MSDPQIAQIRSFNRTVTRRIGALEDSYLSRGRPLGEARVLFEIGPEGAELAALRARLGLDSGYLSRLLRSLENQGLASVVKPDGDGRARRAVLTPAGLAEHAAYDALSDGLAASMLAPLAQAGREKLVAAMAEVERLLRAAAVTIEVESCTSADARHCLSHYFDELSRRFDGGFAPGKGGDGDLAPPSGCFVLARLDGEPVGCAGLRVLDGATAEVKRMWTAPAARGLGVASRMLRLLEKIAAEKGATRLVLDTNRALKEAQALYRRAGFSEVERFNDNPYAHHWFAKAI